jgi:hypothetical protein
MIIDIELLEIIKIYLIEKPEYILGAAGAYGYGSLLLGMRRKSILEKEKATRITSGKILSLSKNKDNNLSVDIMLEYVDHHERTPVDHTLVFETNHQYLTGYEERLRSLSLGLIPGLSQFKGKEKILTERISSGTYVSMKCLPKDAEESVVLSFGAVYKDKMAYVHHHLEEK